MQASNEVLIDSMLNNLFHTMNLDRNEYKTKDFREKLSKTFDNYLYPYKFSETEKVLRTDLHSIASTPKDSSVKIDIFPNGMIYKYFKYYMSIIIVLLYNQNSKEDLERILILEVPKKIIKYAASSNPLIKEKRTKKTGSRGPRLPKNLAHLKGLPEVASIYTDDIDEQGISIHKRSYQDFNDGEYYDTDESNDIDDSYLPNSYKLPENFYILVQELFDEFWAIEFDNIEVTWAFFAKITNYNCKEYSLETFAEESSSLPVIHVRNYFIYYSQYFIY